MLFLSFIIPTVVLFCSEPPLDVKPSYTTHQENPAPNTLCPVDAKKKKKKKGCGC